MPARKVAVHFDGVSFMAKPRRIGTRARIARSDIPEELAVRALAVMEGRVVRTAKGRFTKRVKRS